MIEDVSRFEGAIIGCAVGDALGAPFEGAPRGSLPSHDELISGFRKIPGYPLGQYTDDTQLTVALAESLASAGGFDAEDLAERFARLWRERTIVGAGGACTMGVMNYIDGSPPDKSGAPPGRAGNGTAMRASPVGLYYRNDPDSLAQVSRGHSAITHLDERAAAGAAAVSRAAALAFHMEKPDREEFLDKCAESSETYSPEMAGYIRELLPQIDYDEADVLPWLATVGMDGPTRWLGGITPFVISTVLAALYEFLRHPDDWGAAVTSVIRCGGDVDTTGAIVGAISGAWLGIEAIPGHLVETLKDSDDIRKTARRLYRAASG